MRIFLCLIAALCLGCARDNAATAPSGGDPKPPSPAPEKETDTMRSAALQVSQAQDAILEAYEAAKKLPASLKEDKEEIVGSLDDIGQSLSGGAFETPDTPDNRAKAIVAANDSIMDLRDLQGSVEDLAARQKGAAKDQLDQIDGLIDLAVEALSSAIKTLGGNVESDTP